MEAKGRVFPDAMARQNVESFPGRSWWPPLTTNTHTHARQFNYSEIVTGRQQRERERKKSQQQNKIKKKNKTNRGGEKEEEENEREMPRKPNKKLSRKWHVNKFRQAQQFLFQFPP